MFKHLSQQDPEVAELLNHELQRQQDGLVMIASENFASPAVLEATGSVLTNKYAEGYPGKRYYTGNQYIDQVEQLAIDRAKELFGAEHANVQPHSGSGANMACFLSVLEPGDKIMGMNLSMGGHLTHGSPVNFSGKTYNFVAYGVRKDTEMLDMDEIRELALKEKPKMIISGATAYPRAIDFDAFAAIAQEVGAYAMSDISHISGLVIAGAHASPIASHDIVMTTTTKTLRGPRSAIILSKQEDRLKAQYHPNEKKNLAQLIDFNVFPGIQGGPLEHVIAAKAVAFKEAMAESYQEYQRQIPKNAQVLAEGLMENGIRVVSGGTDNHLLLVDCTDLSITGREGANALEEANIYTNANTVPYDPRGPFNPSGIRIGTPALTSRNMGEAEMKDIAVMIANVLKDSTNTDLKQQVAADVKALTAKFPLYEDL